MDRRSRSRYGYCAPRGEGIYKPPQSAYSFTHTMPSLWSPVLDTLAKVGDLADTSRLSSRPLPKAPDGLSDAQAAAAMFGKTDRRSTVTTVIDTITGQLKRGKPVEIDLETASAAADALLNAKTVGLDDRKYLLEYLFVALSRLPPGSVIQQKIQDAVITLLYSDLPHPPATNVHPDFRFREPDGGNNNPAMPDLGRAGTPYARSVSSNTPIPPANLPSPELIFDTLLRRDTPGGKQHPAGVSSLLFSFAVLIIHSLFRTSPSSVYINDTSSYLDLSPLYGHSLEGQMKVRRNDGTGRLYEDVFAENRLLLMPPAVSALLVMFCRNHNYIATKLLQINESRTFKDPEELKDLPAATPSERAGTWGTPAGNTAGGGHHSRGWTDVSMTDSILSQGATASTAYTTPAGSRFLGLDDQALGKVRTPLEEQDHVIFNTARLINCGFFMHIIISDYIGAILGLTREGSSYSLNPLEEIRGSDHQFVGRGEGNSCSVEFNLLYRWHATLSAADEKWTAEMMKGKFGDVDPNDITLQMFMEVASKDKLTAQSDVRAWTFRGKTGQELQRDKATGRFNDSDLAELLHDAVENVSGAFSARNTPEVLKIVEVLGITQARKWGVCTLNEFRKFIGLKPYESFEEWNPREEIAQAARGLYGHPDNLELYVGMQAEESKPVISGAGLCPGYTISRAILADAVALTRGDRFLTTDFTPQNLTVWGFQDCQRDINNGAFGGVLSKVLMRGLPEHYTFNSVYALFPFMAPSFMKTHLKEMGILGLYDIERPEAARHTVGVNSYKAVREVLGDPKTYKATYEEHMKDLTNGYGFFLAMDDPVAHQRDMSVMHKVMVGSPEAVDYNVAWYAAKTTELVKEKSFSMSKNSTRSVDIVRDVLNLVPVYWVSQEMAGLPLKCKGNEDGLITEQEMYLMMTVVFTHIFLNVEPLNGWQLRDKAKKVSAKLQGIIQDHLHAIAAKGRISFAGIKAFLTDGFYGNDDHAQAFLTNLYKNRGDLTIEQLSYNVFGCMIASVSNYAQAATQVVDFYLDDNRKDLKEIICELSRQDTPESERKLAGYVREAMRLSPQAPGIFRDVTTEVTLQDGKESLHLTPHNRLFVSLANSNLDPEAFPDPHSVNPDRPREHYNLFGYGMHKCMGDQFTERTMPAVIKSIFKLKNVRRAPGESGKLRSFTQDLHGTKQTMFLSATGLVTPWPASMIIQVRSFWFNYSLLLTHVEAMVKSSFMERGVLAGHIESTIFQRTVTLYTNGPRSSESQVALQYPFSIILPTTCDKDTNPLPPSFVCYLPGVSAEIRYRIRIDMSRSGLRRRESLVVPILYLPRSHALPTPRSIPLFNDQTDLLSEDQGMEELHLAPKSIASPKKSNKLKVTPTDDIRAKIALPSPLVVASGERIPFVITIYSQSQALAALYTDISLQLVKITRIKAYEKTSLKEVVLAAGEVYDSEERGNGVQILRGELGNGVPGSELSWLAAGVLEVRHVIRLSIKPPPCTVALSANLPMFEGMVAVEIKTHQYNPDVDATVPALGMIGMNLNVS
ncbi:unnamed protein product [Rhizoctonia solani]|uniref:linoleate 8R-lipoxygenase n=2 Tax=Rhizoctonia solani TaxID=456999 RepID=A0A8H3E3X3_9AGAM|nr:unnamed protein product [Rhizoctonia solani]